MISAMLVQLEETGHNGFGPTPTLVFTAQAAGYFHACATTAS